MLVRLSPALKAELQALAAERGLDMSEVIRQAIIKHLDGAKFMKEYGRVKDA